MAEICSKCGSSAEFLRTVSFVDCPGHHSLMVNMLSGAALMDGALLIISTSEKCPQPQDREHLAAAQITGIKNIIIIQNKIDVVNRERILENFKEIKAFIKDSLIEDAPIIPVSAQREINIDAVIEAIEKTIPTPKRDIDKPFLMPVEDVFSITGRGTVGTGRIERGAIKVGDEVEVVGIKATKKTVVTGVEMFRKILDSGQAGDNVGVLLRGTEKKDLERGQVIAKPGSITPHTKFKAEVYVLTKEEGGRHTPFFNGYRPQFYFRTTDVTGVAKLPKDVEMVMPGDNVSLEAELITPIAMEKELRFAIREGGHTVGAGVVSEVIE